MPGKLEEPVSSVSQNLLPHLIFDLVLESIAHFSVERGEAVTGSAEE